jgi:hypothetical protein
MAMTRTASHASATRGLRAAGAALAPVGAALLLVACGSSSSSASSANASTATNASTAKGNGVASKSPAQIVAAAQTALRSANGFVATGTISQGGEAVQLQVVDVGTSKLQVQFIESGKSAEIVALQGAEYVRANEAFWSAQAGAKAASLANRWIELPASASQQLISGFGLFAPRTLARCLGEDLGTLNRDGTTTVDGEPAIVVHQAGNMPGSSPGTIAVATNGPAYPLRVTSTGPTRPGGKVDVCNTGKGNDAEGSLTLSDFNHAPAITAPRNPMKAGATPSSPA